MGKTKPSATARRRWFSQEDNALKRLVEQLGESGHWHEISIRLRTGRSGKQCRERWHNCVNPYINRGPWTLEEDKLIFRLRRELGNKWVAISNRVPGRSDNQIKNRFHSTIRRLKRAKHYAGRFDLELAMEGNVDDDLLESVFREHLRIEAKSRGEILEDDEDDGRVPEGGLGVPAPARSGSSAAAPGRSRSLRSAGSAAPVAPTVALSADAAESDAWTTQSEAASAARCLTGLAAAASKQTAAVAVPSFLRSATFDRILPPKLDISDPPRAASFAGSSAASSASHGLLANPGQAHKHAMGPPTPVAVPSPGVQGLAILSSTSQTVFKGMLLPGRDFPKSATSSALPTPHSTSSARPLLLPAHPVRTSSTEELMRVARDALSELARRSAVSPSVLRSLEATASARLPPRDLTEATRGLDSLATPAMASDPAARTLSARFVPQAHNPAGMLVVDAAGHPLRTPREADALTPAGARPHPALHTISRLPTPSEAVASSFRPLDTPRSGSEATGLPPAPAAGAVAAST